MQFLPYYYFDWFGAITTKCSTCKKILHRHRLIFIPWHFFRFFFCLLKTVLITSLDKCSPTRERKKEKQKHPIDCIIQHFTKLNPVYLRCQFPKTAFTFIAFQYALKYLRPYQRERMEFVPHK